MKNILVIIGFLFFIGNNYTSAQVLEQKEITGNRFLKTHYSDVLLLKAIVSLNGDIAKKHNIIKYNEDNVFKYDDYLNYLISKNASLVDKLLSEIKYPRVGLAKIQIWCDAYIFTSYERTSEKSLCFEEILYNCKETKHIIKSFLQVEAQDWGSLSSSQIWILPYKFSDYMVTLDDIKRPYIYKVLLEKIRDEMKMAE